MKESCIILSLAQKSFSYRITFTFSNKGAGKIKVKVLPLLSYELYHEDVWSNRGVPPCILKFGTRRGRLICLPPGVDHLMSIRCILRNIKLNTNVKNNWGMNTWSSNSTPTTPYSLSIDDPLLGLEYVICKFRQDTEFR